LSLLCCVFEGAVRKWGVGDASIAARLAYLSKDIVMAGFLAAGACRPNVLTNIAQPFLQLGVGLLAFGAVVSSVFGIDPVGAMLTIRTFFLLPAAALAAGRLLPAESLRRFAIWIAILSVPIAALGVSQFYSASTSPINRYSTTGEDVNIATASVSQRVRATGTFSYISGMGEFAAMAVWAGIVTFTLARTQRERWLGYAALVAGMCCAFVTVSRGMALFSSGLVAVWAVAGGHFGRKAKSAITIGIAGMAILYLSASEDAGDEIVSTVYLRHSSTKNETVLGRLWDSYIVPFEAIDVAPFGNGLGSEQAARTLNVSTTRSGSTFESPWGRTIMELGVLGLLGSLITWGVVFAPLTAVYRTNQQGECRTVLGVTAALLLGRALMGFQFNHVAAYFFWATAAVVLALGNGTASCTPARPARLARRIVGRTQPLV
jgi:hypothetical protein